jgi:hypothetical protein
MQLSFAVRRRQQQAASLLLLVACSILAGEDIASNLHKSMRVYAKAFIKSMQTDVWFACCVQNCELNVRQYKALGLRWWPGSCEHVHAAPRTTCAVLASQVWVLSFTD